MSLQFGPFIAELNLFLRGNHKKIPITIVLEALEVDAAGGGASRALVRLWLSPLQDQWEVARTSCLRDIYFSSN